ncbi:hypothetical protein [Marinospirillum alkaliphilum]|uniref:Uncharacterized protein n=1 Tax=Marinospirillum alkaliphilum DSM 21637 TaxID=1122209 RepID=A0A1K1XQZ4_9GAMM|nr:hypothetical protein [Marinospirillum alkaliphilum]SFX52146.1 hypothetical protein SAMN02745752_01987 [Marinospirillum alkaliphilum DSM 21637]
MSSFHQPSFPLTPTLATWPVELQQATRHAFEKQLFPVASGQQIRLRHINGIEAYLELADVQDGLILLNRSDCHEPPKYFEHHETLISAGWVLA